MRRHCRGADTEAESWVDRTGTASPLSQPRGSGLHNTALQANGEHHVASPWAGGTCAPKYWSCPGDAGFKVRGHKYLKVKWQLQTPFGCKSAILLLQRKHICTFLSICWYVLSFLHAAQFSPRIGLGQ